MIGLARQGHSGAARHRLGEWRDCHAPRVDHFSLVLFTLRQGQFEHGRLRDASVDQLIVVRLSNTGKHAQHAFDGLQTGGWASLFN